MRWPQSPRCIHAGDRQSAAQQVAAALVAEKLKRDIGQLEQPCAGVPSTVAFLPTK
jgi:hypothetical protein